MRYLLYLIISSSYSYCFAQLQSPYFQNFESQEFINDKNVNLDVNGPEPLTRNQVNVTYGYGYSWEITQAPYHSSNVLKLTVHKDDHNKKAEFPRSRSEVTFVVDNFEPVYYSYQIYIPNDDEFVESFENDTYHIIQQFQASLWNPYTNSSYNLYALNERGEVVEVSDLLGILSFQYTDKKENYRDLEFWANDPKNIALYKLGKIDKSEYFKRRKRLKIINGAEKGKWNEFIIKVNHSENSDDGYYQFWINRNPILLDSLGNTEYNEFYSSPHQSKSEAFKLNSGNVLKTTDSFPIQVPALVKLGHYRQNVSNTQSLYIDNFRIWDRFPTPFTKIKDQTTLIDEQCNMQAEENNLILYAYDDPTAPQYTFRFTDVKSKKVKTFKSDGPAIDLRFKRLLKGRKSYEVDIKTNGEFGDKCIVKSVKTK